ncbi:hypothetical protein GO986_12035 [Deinococcus sp. HMF7620]|uniref:Uncharacterized protein n=1 Tax=Deinococcus arboris TaxID=2682977 RepID=A0A7C9HS33_9DEIO|nr:MULTISPECIES: hypothetical protein [Deinococcus]MBZ9752154.1 hypothetical protein [Deinococcus betulae]MVN87494.1 hypothetical protein [Deinococcus arboris]
MSTILSDPDFAKSLRQNWDNEVDELILERGEQTPFQYGVGILLHTIWELRRWPDLSERHRYSLISLGARAYYTLNILVVTSLAVNDVIHGYLAWFAALLVLVSMSPTMYSGWSSDPYGFNLPRLVKSRQVFMLKIGIFGLILLLLTAPWWLKVFPLFFLGHIIRITHGERIMDWWAGFTWRR